MNSACKILASDEIEQTRIELRSDGIIQFYYGNIEYTMKEVPVIEAAVERITKGVTHMSLRVADKYSSMDMEVMKYLSRGRGALFTLADAFVIHSVAQKILANFYLHIIRPVLPTKVFNSYPEAEAWLLSLDKDELQRRHKLKILQFEK
jgi:hypothetical protein